MLSVAMLLWGGLPARAQEVSILLNPQVASEYGLDVGSAEAQLSADIGEDLNLAEQQAFLDAMANAAALSTRGMGVDYASNVQKVVFGASLGSAVSASGLTLSRQGRELPEGGFSLQVAAMAGINLGMGREDAFLSRVRLFVSGMALETSGDTFDAALYNYASHLQLQLVRPREGAGAAWGGLALTSGYAVSGYALALAQPLPIETQLSGLEVGWESTGTYDVTAATASIPLELSSHVRILVVAVYGGVAVDWNQGGADSTIGLSGPLSLTDPQNNQSVGLGSAAVTYGGRGLAAEVVPRAFVGAQLDVLPIKLYGHLNIGMNDSFGGHTGLRFAL